MHYRCYFSTFQSRRTYADQRISSSCLWIYCIVGSFTLNHGQQPWLEFMLEQCLPSIHIFSVRHTATFLHLGILDRTLALHLEATLNSKITNKKAQKCKNVALNRPQKDICLYFESWNKNEECCLIWPHLTVSPLRDSHSPLSTVSQWPQKPVSIDLGITNKF